MPRFIIKHSQDLKPSLKIGLSFDSNENKNINEGNKVMTTSEKIALANEVLDANKEQKFKKIKKDKGLIERTESSKTILTEDNKELLND